MRLCVEVVTSKTLVPQGSRALKCFKNVKLRTHSLERSEDPTKDERTAVAKTHSSKKNFPGKWIADLMRVSLLFYSTVVTRITVHFSRQDNMHNTIYILQYTRTYLEKCIQIFL